MTTKKEDVFTTLLRYADASGHKLNAKHAATATGIGQSTAFARISNAKATAKLDGKPDVANGTEAFQVLLRYADAVGHKFSAKHAAVATGLGQSTVFARIAAAKSEVVQSGATTTEADAKSTSGRKRKTAASPENENVTEATGTTPTSAKRLRTRKPIVKEEENIAGDVSTEETAFGQDLDNEADEVA